MNQFPRTTFPAERPANKRPKTPENSLGPQGVSRRLARPGTCRRCGCTDLRACAGGCFWVDPEHTLCSECEFPGEMMKRLKSKGGRLC
jgi:hypothetical protein